jgi:hypothetical protein
MCFCAEICRCVVPLCGAQCLWNTSQVLQELQSSLSQLALCVVYVNSSLQPSPSEWELVRAQCQAAVRFLPASTSTSTSTSAAASAVPVVVVGVSGLPRNARVELQVLGWQTAYLPVLTRLGAHAFTARCAVAALPSTDSKAPASTSESESELEVAEAGTCVPGVQTCVFVALQHKPSSSSSSSTSSKAPSASASASALPAISRSAVQAVVGALTRRCTAQGQLSLAKHCISLRAFVPTAHGSNAAALCAGQCWREGSRGRRQFTIARLASPAPTLTFAFDVGWCLGNEQSLRVC